MDDAAREKLFVITGGSSGIGFALAETLVSRGARVVILSLHKAHVMEAVKRLGGQSSKIGGYVCDIGVPADVTTVSAAVVAAHGIPDVLVNNAGFAVYRTFEQTPDEEIDRLIDVNYAGAIRVTKAFLGGMIEKRRGQIINVASIAGTMTITPNALYTGAKHGMIAWSRCLAIETARFEYTSGSFVRGGWRRIFSITKPFGGASTARKPSLPYRWKSSSPLFSTLSIAADASGSYRAISACCRGPRRRSVHWSRRLLKSCRARVSKTFIRRSGGENGCAGSDVPDQWPWFSALL